MKESIQLSGKQMAFRQRRSSNSFVLLILLILIVASLYLLRGVLFTQEIKSPFAPTAIPTRTAQSHAVEGETQFNAGNLEAAIAAYQKAVQFEPNNAQIWAELARIQAYSSASLATDDDRRTRMLQALDSINAAIKANPEDSNARAIRAFVLDWNAAEVLAGKDKSVEYLTEAEQEAARALTLDPNNALALAYNAEILVDQQRWVQAEQSIGLAMEKSPNLMDVHRVRAYVQESLGNYSEAIKEYKLAAQVTPNLTFLYIYIGVNYRQLRQYQEALKWFDQAVQINKQLNINDPIPYLAIGRTYSQLGEFYIAGLNVKTALKYNKSNPEVYGSLGVVYFKARNYESSIPALQCAVAGCDGVTSCLVREGGETCTGDATLAIKGMALSGSTVVYYYTYGSVLAAMHTPSKPRCQDAVPILKAVREAYASDRTVISIIEPSEQICANYGYK